MLAGRQWRSVTPGVGGSTVKLELRGITKRFGDLPANDHIDLTIEPGEIHCLLGENGAGKSTLMNVLYGLLPARRGRDPPRRRSRSTSTAPATRWPPGIGMVHQHFMLIPVFTVAENVMLGHEHTKAGGFLDLERRAQAGARDLGAASASTSTPTPSSRTSPSACSSASRSSRRWSRDAQVLDPRRADRRADPAGDRRADGHHAPAQGKRAPRSSSSPTSCARCAAVADRITVIRLRQGRRHGAARPPPTPSSPT